MQGIRSNDVSIAGTLRGQQTIPLHTFLIRGASEHEAEGATEHGPGGASDHEAAAENNSQHKASDHAPQARGDLHYLWRREDFCRGAIPPEHEAIPRGLSLAPLSQAVDCVTTRPTGLRANGSRRRAKSRRKTGKLSPHFAAQRLHREPSPRPNRGTRTTASSQQEPTDEEYCSPRRSSKR